MERRSFREVVDALKAAPRELRGSVKLRAALEGFGVDPSGRVCLDVGASTGGFTSVLLERGAAKVYAVDVGHGQLLGSLRQDPRVRNLEATNIADAAIEETIELACIDVSYLSLSEATVQLNRFSLAAGAELVGLVKPMFELRLAKAPTDEASLADATGRACEAIEGAGWTIVATMTSPAKGTKGSVEGFVHARR